MNDSIRPPKQLAQRLRENEPCTRYRSDSKWYAMVNSLSQMLYENHFTGDELRQIVDMAIRISGDRNSAE